MSADIPEGFAPFKLSMGFLEANGPLYGKWDDDHLLLGFRVEIRHCNPGQRPEERRLFQSIHWK